MPEESKRRLSIDTIQELHRLFNSCDTNGDGFISLKELATTFKNVISNREMYEMFR